MAGGRPFLPSNCCNSCTWFQRREDTQADDVEPASQHSLNDCRLDASFLMTERVHRLRQVLEGLAEL